MASFKIKYQDQTESMDQKTMNILLKKFQRLRAEANRVKKELDDLKNMFQHLQKKRFNTADFAVEIKKTKREYIFTKAEMIEKLGQGYKQYAKTKSVWSYNVIPIKGGKK